MTSNIAAREWNRPALGVGGGLKKGWLVAVDGRLEYGEWETDGREKCRELEQERHARSRVVR